MIKPEYCFESRKNALLLRLFAFLAFVFHSNQLDLAGGSKIQALIIRAES